MPTLTLGVDIGGSHILSAAVNTQTGQILEPTRAFQKVDNKGSQEAILTTWASALNRSLEQVDRSDLNGIGFAMPGPFNFQTGIALYEGESLNDKYGALYQVDVAQALRPFLIYDDLPMRFLNDATSFAVGVAWFGKAKDARKSLSITLGTGLGSAYVEDGVPVVTRADVAKHGCLWHLPYRDGMADDYFSTRWFVKSYRARSGQEVSGVKEIAARAPQEATARQLFEEFGHNLGSFLAPWLRKFPAEVLVLGGNITGAFELFAPSLRHALREADVATELAVSVLKEDAALIGSARTLEADFWERVKDDLPVI